MQIPSAFPARLLSFSGRTRSCCSSVRLPAQRMQHSPAPPAAATPALLLADAHCHPQDDPQHLSLLSHVQARHLAVMGTRQGDWHAVEQLYLNSPHKVIPCFGVHPWWAHLHALSPRALGSDLIEEMEPGGEDPSELSTRLLASRPSSDWEPRLREYLIKYPQAVVGEFGLDRAAIIPGTKLRVRYSHQLQLTELHLRLAAELGRPVSMHCVRAYGHLHDMLRRLGPATCPPCIMLHSFGGSPESVKQFTLGLPAIGPRLYFSFSTTINGKNRDKLVQRIQAVPDDRLLLESDQNTPREVDSSLAAILQLVAEAKGWDEQQTARQAMANFDAFFSLGVQQAGPGVATESRREEHPVG